MEISFPRIRLTLMCMLLTMSVSFSMITATVSQPSTTRLYVDPPKTEFWATACGETFMVNVSIANVSDLQSFEFKLYWNTTLLDLIEFEVYPFFKGFFWANSETNETLGMYWLNETSLEPPPGVNGSGPLVALTFNMTYKPVWPENVSCALDLADTKLADSGGNSILHEVDDGEYVCYSIPLLSVTTATDKPSYDVNEIINVYGNLTLGFSPVQDGLVALEIDDPLNQIIVIRTLSTGLPPANQTVEIIDVTPCGGPPDYNPRTWFYRGYMAYFNVTLRNNDNESRRVLAAINVYDVNLITLGTSAFEAPIPGGSTSWAIFSFYIPDTASIGNATVYTSALTGLPRNGGTAYCPEENATFEIRDSGGAGSATGSLQVSGSSPEGTYNLTFKLGSDERLGNYGVYTASDYTIHGCYQKATSNLTFKIGGPWDVNDDGVVDVVDLTIVALALWSQPGDENWDPRADCAEPYGIIDIVDLTLVAIHLWS